MHYRRLGRSGLKVSEISLGAWITFGAQVDLTLASDLIHAAYEAGVNFFDNADMYAGGQAETLMGEAIRDLPRQALVLSSKVFWPTMPGPNGRGLSRKHIMESAHASLKRMGTDYLDLYFCHRFDPDSPMEEVVRAMSDLVQQGKVLYWGTSEWRAWQISSAFCTANNHHLVAPSMEQPQYNMLHRDRLEAELAPLCKDLGIGLTTWSPLYFGILSGKYNDGIPDGTPRQPVRLRLDPGSDHPGEHRQGPRPERDRRGHRSDHGPAGDRLDPAPQGGQHGHHRGDQARPAAGESGSGRVRRTPER